MLEPHILEKNNKVPLWIRKHFCFEISKSSLLDTRFRCCWTNSYLRCGSGLIACLFEEQKNGAKCTHHCRLILSHLLLSACQITHSLIILIPRNKRFTSIPVNGFHSERKHFMFDWIYVEWYDTIFQWNHCWRCTAKCSFLDHFL